MTTFPLTLILATADGPAEVTGYPVKTYFGKPPDDGPIDHYIDMNSGRDLISVRMAEIVGCRREAVEFIDDFEGYM